MKHCLTEVLKWRSETDFLFSLSSSVCVCVCVRACVYARARVCVCARACVNTMTYSHILSY